jgi:AAA domain/Bifunctional DNA primase/polymerase, N-terminal
MSLPDDQTNLNPTGFDPDFASPREWAEMYRAAGLQVVPCKDKRPDLSRWADLQNTLVSDATFARWYRTGSEHGNMGVITGPCSGNVLSLDLDFHKNVAAAVWWQGLIDSEASGIEPETVEQITGGGGEQKLFRAPPGYRIPTNRTAIGVDIRGQAGFAVLPPTLHQSGTEYAWKPLRGPWEIPIAIAPQWLLDAIEALVGEHGGHQGDGVRTASPEADYDAFGNVQDGREVLMRDCVWRAVLERYREAPIKPPDAASMIMAKEAYEGYERKVTTRLADVPLRDGLEREGRGPTAFYGKWRATMRHWGSAKMVAEAAKPKPVVEKTTPQLILPPKIDPVTGEVLPLLLTAKQFLRGFVPPDYLIDGVIQKSYLYSLTARTGHGKTAVAMLMASCIARGVPFHGHEVAKGQVLFLAGENPQDVRARYKVLADTEQFSPEGIPFHFVDGVIDIAAFMPAIIAEAAKIGDLSLVVVDTATAYFRGDDSNSNAQQGLFAQLLRQLIKLPGAPAVVVNCHPVKNAAQDNLIPLGGSNFINEVDGNLTLWADDKTCILAPHSAKWRGAPFEQVEFELRSATSDTVKDSKGRHMPSVVAVPISEAGAERRGAVAQADGIAVLGIIHTHKDASMSDIARKLGFVLPNGQPYKSKVQKVIERLKDSKLVFKVWGGKYRLTKKGCKVAKVKWDEDDDAE